jgi:GTP cyclohydrolase II
MLVHLAQIPLQTIYGTFEEHLFYDGQQELFALVMGEVAGGEAVLCRVHSSCIFGHHFNSIECDCREQMALSQQLIQQAGRGVVIWMEQEGKGNGHLALMKSIAFKKQGMTQAQAYEAVGAKKDARDFSRAADILRHLGIQSICMLTNNPDKVDTLTRHGIVVAETHPLVVPSLKP